MSGIKLISIKHKEEVSYFYKNEGATLDKNDSEAVVTEEKIDKNASEKSKKALEREKKQREKELKQHEKETKASKKKKNSKYEKQTKITPNAANNNESPPANGDINRGLEDRSDEANNHQEVSRSDEAPIDSSEDTSTDNMQATEPINANLGSHVVEEIVRPEEAKHSEEAPPDILPWHPRYEEETPQQGQHVEIEISEVTELEDTSEQTNEQEIPLPQTTESTIMVATVQEVESGEDLDSFFVEVYGQPGQKETDRRWSRTVRFQEPEPGDESDRETEASERDVEDDEEKQSTDESGTLPEQTQESVDKEERGNLESCEVNWDEIFEECETEIPTNSNESAPSAVENHLVEIEINEIAEEKEHGRNENVAEKKKEKRKRGRLMACCFP